MTLKEKFDKCKDSKNQYYVIPISDDSKQLVKIAEDFAIGFAEWLIEKEREHPNRIIRGIQLLEIYKKEKGL